MSIVAGYTEPQEGAWPGENVPGEVTGQRSRPGYQVTLCLSPSLRYHGCHTVFFMDSGTVILCHKTVT